MNDEGSRTGLSVKSTSVPSTSGGRVEKGRMKRNLKWEREGKIYISTYMDDIALLSEDEEGMRKKLGKIERYLDKKEFELNTGKSKIIGIGSGKGGEKIFRGGREEWKNKRI